jgi:hypothetical protein
MLKTVFVKNSDILKDNNLFREQRSLPIMKPINNLGHFFN